MKDLTDTHIYYINLDNRIDRKKQFEEQEALAIMPPIERISAVQGVSVDVRKNKNIGLNTRVQLITEYRRSHYEIHSRGAIGASLSHIKTWKEFLKSNDKYALIMEDDVQLPPTFALMFKDSVKDLPNEWDIWILGWNHNVADNIDTDKSPFRQVLQFTGAHCYVISRRAAKLMIEESFPIETHIEYFMSNVAFIYGLNIIRDVRLHLSQMDRVKNISDVRKPTGCPTCIVDDKEQAVQARRANMP